MNQHSTIEGNTNKEVFSSETPHISEPCLITESDTVTDEILHLNNKKKEENIRSQEESPSGVAAIVEDREGIDSTLPRKKVSPSKQAAIAESNVSALPRTDVFDISLIKVPEQEQKEENELDMDEADDQFDISNLHIPKTKATGKLQGNKEKKVFKQKYISINAEWDEMSTRLKAKKADDKRKGRSTTVSGTI